MRGEKPLLYRKVNSTAYLARHGTGRSASEDRNTKDAKRDESTRGSMHPNLRHGFDYTPLYRFLLSRVGAEWAGTYQEAASRLDQVEPIFRMVQKSGEPQFPYLRSGESTYFSTLFVDADGRLAICDPSVTKDTLEPMCKCCTHTFNGQPFGRKYIAKAD
jgi:hypothetical protein